MVGKSVILVLFIATFTVFGSKRPEFGISITNDAEKSTYIWRTGPSGFEAAVVQPKGYIIVNPMPDFNLIGNDQWQSGAKKYNNAKMAQLINGHMSKYPTEYLLTSGVWEDIKSTQVYVFDGEGHAEKWFTFSGDGIIDSHVVTFRMFKDAGWVQQFSGPSGGIFTHPVFAFSKYGFKSKSPFRVLYHATGSGAKPLVDDFVNEGKQSMHGGSTGKFGPGLYFAETERGARLKTQSAECYMIKAEVFVGHEMVFKDLKSAQESKGLPTMFDTKPWDMWALKNKFDSIHLLRVNHMDTEGEYVVFHPDQVEIISISQIYLDKKKRKKYKLIKSDFNRKATAKVEYNDYYAYDNYDKYNKFDADQNLLAQEMEALRAVNRLKRKN